MIFKTLPSAALARGEAALRRRAPMGGAYGEGEGAEGAEGARHTAHGTRRVAEGNLVICILTDASAKQVRSWRPLRCAESGHMTGPRTPQILLRSIVA